jgi:hypothetical protein
MRRRLTILLLSCLLLLVAGLLLLPQAPGPRCQLALTIVTTTNPPTGARMVTLRLLNIGQRSARVLPTYGVESQPPKVDASMVGSVSSAITTLRPGEACTNTIAIPTLPDRSWRVFFRYWEMRPPFKQFSHYWLMQAGLAKREESGSIVYTDWVTNGFGIQPDGAANGSQPIRSDTDRTSSAAGSGR